MKINILLTILLISISTVLVNAQEVFPDHNDHQKWEYVTWYFWGGWCQINIIKTGELVELCEGEYIEVFNCDENESNCDLIGYYNIMNDSVMVRDIEIYLVGGEWTDSVNCDIAAGLMYDFSLDINEVIQCQLNYPTPVTDFTKVDENIIVYEGINRPTLEMTFTPYPNIPPPAPMFTTNWVKGIGSDIHPFYSLTCIGDHCEQEQQLTKVFKNDVLIYLDTFLTFSYPCTNETVAINEPIKQSLPKYTTYPNPVKSELTIKLETGTNLPIEAILYNILGIEIQKINLANYESNIIMESFPNGIYLLEIKNKFKKRVTKIIKE